MNWGNRLLVGFLVFAGGMSFLVYRSMKTNYELVEKDYYKSEIAYQQVIDGTNRANGLQSQALVEQTADGIVITMPGETREKVVTGDVWFYCSYDQKKDRRVKLDLSAAGKQVIAHGHISPGNYVVKLSWQCEGKNYFTEKPLRVL